MSETCADRRLADLAVHGGVHLCRANCGGTIRRLWHGPPPKSYSACAKPTATWPRGWPSPMFAGTSASRRTPAIAGGSNMTRPRSMRHAAFANSKPRSSASRNSSSNCCSTSRCSRTAAFRGQRAARNSGNCLTSRCWNVPYPRTDRGEEAGSTVPQQGTAAQEGSGSSGPLAVRQPLAFSWASAVSRKIAGGFFVPGELAHLSSPQGGLPHGASPTTLHPATDVLVHRIALWIPRAACIRGADRASADASTTGG
jgi:hypothetical protein